MPRRSPQRSASRCRRGCETAARDVRRRAAREPASGRLGALAGSRRPRRDRLTHLEVLPARAGGARRLAGLGRPGGARRRSRARGVDAPVAAPGRRPPSAAHAGRHVVLATGTASGKSLAYLLPALHGDPRGPRPARPARRERRSTSRRPRRSPRTSSRRCAALGVLGRAGRHPRRRHARASSATGPATTREYVLTNPDMLHRSLLPGARALGARSSASLRYVVVDECHHYRGVFGAHVAHVLRRLRRVCALYGAAPDVRARLGDRRRARGRRPAG